MSKVSTNYFIIYYLYYKKKLYFSNLIKKFVCNIKPGLVIKKKLPKTFIYFSNFLQLLFFLLSYILSKICLVIFKYFLIFKYITIFN